MRPIQLSLTGTGNTGWQIIDYRQAPTTVTLGVNISGTATASVYFTLDDPAAQIVPVSIVQTASTTVTVTTSVKHGLTTNDWVQISNTGAAVLNGLFQVATVPSDTTYTYVTTTGTNTGNVSNQFYTPFRTFLVSGLSAVTSTTVSNLAFPVQAVMMNCSAYTSGAVLLNILQGLR